jgi:hypothetical protein
MAEDTVKLAQMAEEEKMAEDTVKLAQMAEDTVEDALEEAVTQMDSTQKEAMVAHLEKDQMELVTNL